MRLLVATLAAFLGSTAISSATILRAGATTGTLLFVRGQGCNDGTGLDIYTVRSDGSRLQRLTRDEDSSLASWSADGREIFFTRGNGDCTSAFESDVFTMNAEGSDAHALTHDRNSSTSQPSPDGRKLAFTTGGVLFVGDSTTGGRRVVVRDKGGAAWAVAWSPDSKRLLYTATGLGVVGADGTNKRLIAGNAAETASWSPNGRQIAFSRCLAGDALVCDSAGLWLSAPDGSHRRQLTRQPLSAKTTDLSPVWSPDGKRLAFARTVNGAKSSLVVITVSDGKQRNVVTGGFVDSPAWSADGSLIAFSRAGGIWVVRPDGTGLRRLTTSRAGDDYPLWQP
jgi:Tol biopolymer transport system component